MSLDATNIQMRALANGSPHNPSDGSWNDRSTNASYYVGNRSTSTANVLIVKFTLEKPAKAINLSLTDSRGYPYVYNVAIFDYENDTYNTANHTFAGNGTITLSKYSYTAETATLEMNLRAGTYYMYIYSSVAASTVQYSQIQNNANGRITITYEELEGSVNVGSRKGIVKIYKDGAWRVGLLSVYKDGAWRVGG